MPTRRVSLLIAVALAASPTAAAAQADAFCDGLKKIATASFETPAFKSVVRVAGEQLPGTVLPGGFTSCSATRMSMSSQYGCSVPVPSSAADAVALADGIKGLVKKCFNDPLSYQPGLADQYAAGQTNFVVAVPAGTTEIAVFAKLTSNAEYRTVNLIVLGPEKKN